MPNFSFEALHEGLVAGVDEAGRGPWAGPVVAAAVVFYPERSVPRGIKDSKQLTPEQRENLFHRIQEVAVVGIAAAEVTEIDHYNILMATKLAMQRAVAALSVAPVAALIDGNQPPRLPMRAIPIIKGDSLSVSIAAASIMAKVTRDRLMCALAQEFPQYGWHRNMGYGTPEHQRCIAQHGVTHHHRRSFAPVREYLMAREMQVAE